MKSEYAFLAVLVKELARRCSTSATLDLKKIRGRIEHEGLSFLTITLPSFGKDFERSLDQGYVSDDLFPSFQKRKSIGGLPEFLQGFLRNVFSANDGVLLSDPCVDSIQAIRQITLLFSKVSLPCSDARTRKAIREYVECEQELRCTDQSLSASDLEDFRRVSRALYRHFFTEIDREIYQGNVMPKHGPGGTADKLRGNAKFRLNYWTDRLEAVFPALENILPSYSYWEKLDDIEFLEPGSEIPVKVITVPKTLKTPRVIAMEPTAMQYAQQGVLELFLNVLRRTDGKKFAHRSLHKMIGIDDQDPNRSMAQIGSLTGALATLDLSEASDRVSNQQVRELTRDWPHLSMALDATRSRKADVPGHGVIRLAKFASMGSALCFPVEAMVFLTMIFIGIEREHRTHIDSKLITSYEDKVRVFGDDIIVPEHIVHSVVRTLTTFGSKVNTSKSFWTGKFRESCGKEYYDGHDVSIVKVRRMFPTQRNRVEECISIVSLRNQLYWAGLWDTARWLDELIGSVLKHYPVVEPTSPVLGRESVLPYQAGREHEHYHSPLVKGYVVSSNPPADRLDDRGALLKFLLKRGGLPSVDSRHLERAGRPHAVNIKLRWASPF